MKHAYFFLNLVLPAMLLAQGPEVTSWIINTNNALGYNNIPSNVQQVQYSTSNVYVSCTCIPSYPIGPWPSNPNTPTNQNFVYKITRNPVQNTATPIATPMGHIGVWSNGVSIFNTRDGMSYNNLGIWNQDAYVFEGISFDACLGHPAPNGEYHHHINPTCLYNDADSLNHSPIIGYAFDGFPIYGAYTFTNINGTGPIKRMQSSYRLRNITTRDTLPDGTPLSAPQQGPVINATYPLGSYLEDYEYLAASGDLDEHNGRFCITPEYPAGIYAYFVTINAALDPVFPYTLGPTYYGTVQAGNTGPGSGHNIITETVVTYNPSGIVSVEEDLSFLIFPNPCTSNGGFSLFIDPIYTNDFTLLITDLSGRELRRMEHLQPSVGYFIETAGLPCGTFIVGIRNSRFSVSQKIIVVGE